MRKVVMALVAALSALLAVPAIAADGTLSSSARTYAWEGGPGNGVGQNAAPPTPGASYANARCTDIYFCDNELLELKEPGSLTIEIKAGEGSNDLDIRLYPSDASGTAPGGPQPGSEPPKPIAEDISTNKDAKITVKGLKAGFYVAQVAFFNAQEGMYNGTAAFTPAAPPAAAPQPGTPTTAPQPGTPPATEPAPQQTSPTPADTKAAEAERKKKLAACNKKAKKVKSSKKRAKALKACKKKHAKKKA
jgi:hypothetical protein